MNAKKYFLGKVNPYLLSAVLLTLLAVTFYPMISADSPAENPSADTTNDIVQRSSDSQSLSDTSNKIPAVEDLIDGLRTRLEASEDDMQGWILLAKSYHHVQRWADATDAFKRAKALGYSGEMPWSETSKDYIPPALPFNDNFLQEYFAAQANKNKQTIISQTKAINQKASATQSVSLNLVLSLDPTIKDKLDPNLTVYIFARAFEPSGSAISGPPLAALRMLVSDLPVSVSLNDKMAVIPGRTISSVKQLVVGARVSLSGGAIRQNGDFEQVSDPIAPTFQDILPLVISKQVIDNRPS
ncbi:MAG: hypothetical protein ACI88A_002870 [Paraglaciecola sp.]|jgi:hypothetical protein